MGTIEVTTTRKKATESSMLVKRRTSANLTDGFQPRCSGGASTRIAGQTAKRVVGINVVDGRNLVVRGMGGRYTSVLLNACPFRVRNRKSARFPLIYSNGPCSIKSLLPRHLHQIQRANFSGGSLN